MQYDASDRRQRRLTSLCRTYASLFFIEDNEEQARTVRTIGPLLPTET